MHGIFVRILLVLAGSFLLCIAGPAGGQADPLSMSSEDEREVTWELSADSITTLNDNEIMEAQGNVYLRRGEEYLKADFARYYMSTKWVFLRGNVQVRMGKDELQAAEAEFDLRSRVGWLKQGRVFMAGPHAYIAGEHINKHWGDVYSFKQAKITTCDGDVPAWAVTADEAVVEIDGYARLSRSSFLVSDVPVGFFPYFVFPTKTTRQTGFLTPEYGRTTRKGLYYNQPFFWAINESSDLTLNEYFMDKRGFMHGLEYRTRPAADSTGWMRLDWLKDKKQDLDDQSGFHDGDNKIRTNTSRYWLRGMYDSRLPDPDWRLKADLDYVSDQDYLAEFRRDMPGFNRTRETLFNLFSRDLREKNDHRESGILLSRDWERATVSLFGQYTQDPGLGHGNQKHSKDSTVQRLPQLDAFLHKGRIVPSLPLEADVSAQAAYMYRRNGTRGARYEVVPRLTLPLSNRYGSIIAQTNLRQTLYSTENQSHSGQTDRQGPKENDDSRTMAEYSVAATTDFSRVFSLERTPLQLDKANAGKSQWLGLRHSVQPRLEYAYRTHREQDDLPYYDDNDRIEPRAELIYSVTNVLTRKSESIVMEKDASGQVVPVRKEGYAEVGRFRLEQAYDNREATRDRERDKYPRRPYSDVLGELEVALPGPLWFTTRNHWSPYLNILTRHQAGFDLRYPEYGRFYVGYDQRKRIHEYKRERDRDIQYLTLDVDLDYFESFKIGASYRHDFEDNKNKEKELRLIYNHQCFQVIGSMLVEPDEESYNLMLVFTGLGN